MSKGDWRRPPTVDGETLRSNYEETFGPRTDTEEPRRVRAVPGGAVIPFERFANEASPRPLPAVGEVIVWNGIDALVKVHDLEAQELHVDWCP